MVSLDRTPERTSAGLINLQPLGLRVEVVPACDGSSPEGVYYPRDPRTTELMQPGEVGICMSFLKVCALIVRDDLPWALSFEDDVEIIHTEGLMGALKALPEDFHFAHINDADKPAPVILSEGPGPWLRVQNPSYVTVAYVISNAGARAALKGMMPLDRPVDVWLKDNPQNLNFYQISRSKAWFTQNFWRPSTVRANGVENSIPKIIHRIWLGDKPLPQEFEEYWKTWEAYHPDYRFITWRDTDTCVIPPGLHPAAQSDLLRLHILYKYGGLYVDTDFECFHNFDRLLASGSLIVGEESRGWICNGIMAASRGHELVKKMSEQALTNTLAGMPILKAAGPGLVQSVVNPWKSNWSYELKEKGQVIAHKQGDTGITIIDSRTLFPYLWNEPRPSSYGKAWAAHHWGRSWWTPEDWTNFYNQYPQLCPA